MSFFSKLLTSMMVGGVVMSTLWTLPVFAETLVDENPSVTLGALPIPITAGQTKNLRLSYTDNSGISYCIFTIITPGGSSVTIGGPDSSDLVADEGNTPTSGGFKAGYTFSAPGSYEVFARCYDTDGHTGAALLSGRVTVAAPTDAIAPTVRLVTPISTATPGQTKQLSLVYGDDTAIDYCYIRIGVPGLGPTSIGYRLAGDPSLTADTGSTPQAGVFAGNFAFNVVGRYSLVPVCHDLAGNVTTGVSGYVDVAAPVAVDTVAPVVSSFVPLTATVGTPVTFSVSFSDAVGVQSCEFQPAGGSVLTATRSGSDMSGTASRTHTFTSAGTLLVTARCSDAAGNIGTESKSVTVEAAAVTPVADTVAPVVSSFVPLTATVGTPVTFSVSFSDAVGVQSCEFQPAGGSVLTATRSGSDMSGTASRTHTFTSAGTLLVTARCSDAAGNIGTESKSVTVSAASTVADTVAPTVGVASPSTATVGGSVTYSASFSDNVGVTSCTFYADSVAIGSADRSGSISGTASRSYAFTSAGTHTVSFTCYDAVGNARSSGAMSVNVVAVAAGTDRTPPVVSTLVPGVATVGVSVRLSAATSDAGSGVSQCLLYVNGANQGAMDLSGGIASRSYLFSSTGLYSAFLVCRDAAGNEATGPSSSITVTAAVTTPPFSGTATRGNLIKAVCPGYVVGSDHPCRAVYYYGQDGRRHAFPNSQVYFTWYADFSGVVEVSDAFLASIGLGRNVNYRPGVRMVKFTTLDRVYAVGRGGSLRWVSTEAVAVGLYGSNWNRQIDDISDVFFTDYTFGADITDASQFVPSRETSLVQTVDQN